MFPKVGQCWECQATTVTDEQWFTVIISYKYDFVCNLFFCCEGHMYSWFERELWHQLASMVILSNDNFDNDSNGAIISGFYMASAASSSGLPFIKASCISCKKKAGIVLLNIDRNKAANAYSVFLCSEECLQQWLTSERVKV